MARPSITSARRRRLLVATVFFGLCAVGGLVGLLRSGVGQVGPWIAVVGGSAFVLLGLSALRLPVDDETPSLRDPRRH